MAFEDTTTLPAPVKRPALAFTDQLIEPLSRLQSEIERLFDGFPTRMPSVASLSRLARPIAVPALELKENDGGYKLTAELPGMDADDVEVSVADGMLTISGEKKQEREEKDKGYFLSERSYGAFERRIELPADAAAPKITAEFKKGVLTLTLPRDERAAQRRQKIQIKKG